MIPVIFIPSAPLLLPTLNPAPLPEHLKLRAHVVKACAALAEASRVIIIGGQGVGQRPDATRRDAGIEFFPFELPGCEPRFDGSSRRGDPPVLPLSLTIGRWALPTAIHGASRAAGHNGPDPGTEQSQRVWPADGAETSLVMALASGSTDDLGSAIAELSSSVLAPSADTAVIVVGDGTATRHEKAPGHTMPGAVDLDDQIAVMLGSGDLDGLMELSDEFDATFALDGRCAWQAASALVSRWPASLAKARLIEYDAPHHVAYFVARWELELTA